MSRKNEMVTVSLNCFDLHAKSCSALMLSLRIPLDGRLEAGRLQIINCGPVMMMMMMMMNKATSRGKRRS